MYGGASVKAQGYASLFSRMLSGLAYPLENATLSPLRALGISNELIGKAASVSLASGILLLFYPYQKDALPTINSKDV